MKGERCPFKHDPPAETAAPVPQKLPRVTVERPAAPVEAVGSPEGLEEVQDALNTEKNRTLSESFIDEVSEFFEAEDKVPDAAEPIAETEE